MVYPFAYRDTATKCLGSYERELHAEIERIVARGYKTVLNAGCGEGYYAVGLARRMSGLTTVLAYDYNPSALALCRRLAEANRVPHGRIVYGGEVTDDVLKRACGHRTLVLADIEGAELKLLDPVSAPRLADSDILVEVHDFVSPGVETVLRSRFAESHEIRAIESEPRRDPDAYPELDGLRRWDQLAVLLERRMQMGWLMMIARGQVTELRPALP